VTIFSFRLYILGDSPRSRAAEQGLRRLCAARLDDGTYVIEAIDVAEHRDVAETERVVATPTLDRIAPPPRVRVIGDLGSSDELASAVLELLTNSYANGEVVRIDGGARLQPK